MIAYETNAKRRDRQLGLVPATDVDRAKDFYTDKAGFDLDVDHRAGDDFRVVQLTPPGSACSISVGKGITKTAPGSVEGLHVVVTDIVAARDELVGRGADVGEIFHFGESGQAPGPHPERADHGAFASFSDPDGNTWVLGGQPKRDGRVTRPVEPTDDIAAAIAGYERAFAALTER